MYKEFFPKSFVLLALGILTIPVALALYSPGTVVSAQTGETPGSLTVLGVEVVLDAKNSKIIIGRLSIDKLETLATLRFVRYVTPQVSR